MNFNTYFRLTSYATVASAALALFVAGGVGVGLAAVFAVVLIVGWNLKGTRWQLSERIALIVILVSLPIFYLDWRILTPYLQIESSLCSSASLCGERLPGGVCDKFMGSSR